MDYYNKHWKKTDFCWPALFDWVAIQIFCHGETEAQPEHFQMQRCCMSHLVLLVFLNSSSHAGHDAALLFVLGKSAFSIIQFLSCSMLPFIGQSRRKVGDTEESCVWLRWYSIDRVQDNDIVFFVYLLEHGNTPLLISSCPGVMEWSAPACLYSEKERMTDREQKSSVTGSPSILHILTWAAATLTRGGKRRGRFNWSGTSGELRSSEWVQPLLSPTPTLKSPFHPF